MTLVKNKEYVTKTIHSARRGVAAQPLSLCHYESSAVQVQSGRRSLQSSGEQVLACDITSDVTHCSCQAPCVANIFCVRQAEAGALEEAAALKTRQIAVLTVKRARLDKECAHVVIPPLPYICLRRSSKSRKRPEGEAADALRAYLVFIHPTTSLLCWTGCRQRGRTGHGGQRHELTCLSKLLPATLLSALHLKQGSHPWRRRSCSRSAQWRPSGGGQCPYQVIKLQMLLAPLQVNRLSGEQAKNS